MENNQHLQIITRLVAYLVQNYQQVCGQIFHFNYIKHSRSYDI
jgi:hypothetical protein